MDTPVLIGSCGAAIILVAFIAEQLHMLRDTDIRYDAANAVGSLLLVWYAWVGESYPFFVLNSVWALVSLRDVVRWCVRKK